MKMTQAGWVLGGMLALAGIMGGCEVPGYVAGMVVPETIPAVFALPAQKTVVLVDDPDHWLEDAGLTGEAAVEVGKELREAQVVPEIIEPAAVVALAERLGSEFAHLPVNQVGAQVGAAQVVHVLIAKVQFQEELGMIHPSALARVKVIDVQAGKRLFPPPAGQTPGMTGPAEAVEGHLVQVKLRYRYEDYQAAAALPMARKALAREIGREVGRLFYARKTPAKAGDWTSKDVTSP